MAFADPVTGQSVIPQYAYANPTASGNTQVVATQGAGVKVRVLSVFVVTDAAVTIKFQSASTDISSGKPCAANGGFIQPVSSI